MKSKKKNYKEAIGNYKISYNLKKQNASPNIDITLIGIIECYNALEQVEESEKWLMELHKFQEDERKYYTMKKLEADIELLRGKETSFEQKKKEALDYFISNDNYKDALGISRKLGEYYCKQRSYKKAAHFLSKEIDILNKLKFGV